MNDISIKISSDLNLLTGTLFDTLFIYLTFTKR
jgi:hypothetical protein